MTERELTYTRALNEAHQIMMRRDKNVIVIGENVSSSWRGATKGLKEEFGIDRVRDTPITETSFVGMGVGAAIMGLRPIVELMNVDFGLVAALNRDTVQAVKARVLAEAQKRHRP